MEEFSVQPLSEGLGFYEKSPVWSRAEQNHPLKEQKTSRPAKGFLPFPDIPEELLPEKLDLEKEQTYHLLRALLEKPYLGEQAEKANPNLETRGGLSPHHKGSSPALAGPAHPSPHHKVPQTKAVAGLNRNKAPEGDKPSPSAVVLEPARPDFVPSKGRNGNHEQKQAKAARPDFVPSKGVLPALDKKFCFSACFSWKAVLTDFFVVSLVFFPPFVLFMFLTETLSFSVLGFLWPKILLAFAVFAGMYCLLCRLFCFETYGEAVAKIRLTNLRSPRMPHPFALFWRFLLSCSTGMVLLPLLSLVFKKDIAGHLTGLYSQKTNPVK